MKRVVAVASVTEDAAAINESRNSVLGTTLFAVDAPDGEHDMEDVVSQESQYCLGAIAQHTQEKEVHVPHAANPKSNHSIYNHVCCAMQEEHMKGVENIIMEASLFENPEEVRKQQHFRDECRKAAVRTTEHDL